MCVCVHVRVHARTCVRTYVCSLHHYILYLSPDTHTYVHAHTHIHAHTHTHTHTHTQCCIDNAQEMAEVILEHDVDLNARDIEGWSALHAAAATGNVQMINLLVDEGASLVAINNDDKMPVDVAADGDIRYILQQKMLEAGGQ